jgi:hypothetical protein
MRLLAEIDREGGPEAARTRQPHRTNERDQTMQETQPGQAPRSETLPLGKLLAWADAHPDKRVRTMVPRVRDSVAALRTRYDADNELADLAAERERLEQQLSKVAARERQLAPGKTARQPPSYDSVTVRKWAAAKGIQCPPRGRIPTAVLDAWRQDTEGNG